MTSGGILRLQRSVLNSLFFCLTIYDTGAALPPPVCFIAVSFHYNCAPAGGIVYQKDRLISEHLTPGTTSSTAAGSSEEGPDERDTGRKSIKGKTAIGMMEKNYRRTRISKKKIGDKTALEISESEAGRNRHGKRAKKS